MLLGSGITSSSLPEEPEAGKTASMDTRDARTTGCDGQGAGEGGVRKAGIIGGMSWYSSLEYYRTINTLVQQALGGHHSARLALESLDFDQIRSYQVAEDWTSAGQELAAAGARLEQAGCGLVLIATNLMHKVAPAVADEIDVPLLHIADAVAVQAIEAGHARLGLLGTAWTMRETFYADRLLRHGLTTVVPDSSMQSALDTLIFDELTQGVFSEPARQTFLEAIDQLVAQGATAIILGCTEIGLLITDADTPTPLLDSAQAHAECVARWLISGDITRPLASTTAQ